jgi:hypothetical protein
LETQKYKGQMIGTSSNDSPVYIRTDSNGSLQTVRNYGEIEVLTSDTRTVSGNSLEFDAFNYKEAVAFLDVTVASGTSPTLDVKFQTQDPISLKWFDLSELTFTQKTAIGNEMKINTNTLGSKLRCVYTIGGDTPSFDFSVGLILKS